MPRLELLGPAFTWSTPVWLQGPVVDGVLQGNLVIKGTGDPKLVLERIWLLMRRVQQAGVREIRGDIVVDRSAFVPGEVNPGRFRRRAAAPLQRRRRRAAPQLPLGPADDHARPGARRRRRRGRPAARRRARRRERAARQRPLRRLARRAQGRLRRPDPPRPARRVPGGLRRAGLGDRLCRPAQLHRARPDRHVAGARRPDRRRLSRRQRARRAAELRAALAAACRRSCATSTS